MNVKLFRMQSGEEVIADLIEDKGETMVIANPIVMVPGHDGKIGFAPWCPLVAEEVKELEIRSSFTVYVTIPNVQVVKNYEEIFSPIITPSNKGLIL
mgnify:CR=1 FL=1